MVVAYVCGFDWLWSGPFLSSCGCQTAGLSEVREHIERLF